MNFELSSEHSIETTLPSGSRIDNAEASVLSVSFAFLQGGTTDVKMSIGLNVKGTVDGKAVSRRTSVAKVITELDLGSGTMPVGDFYDLLVASALDAIEKTADGDARI